MSIEEVTARAYAMAKARVEAQAAIKDTKSFMLATKILSDDPAQPRAIPWEAWEALCERLESWDGGRSEVILKDRQLGFSWTVGGYATRRASLGHWRVAMLSAGQREARSLLLKCRYLYEHLPSVLQVGATWRTDDVQFKGGGSITVYPSTESAGIGEANQLVVGDEAAFHPYGAQNYAAILPSLSAGGQFITLSTADPTLGPAGFYHDLYFAAKRGENGYKAVFVPWEARPGRNLEWYEREKRKYSGDPEAFAAFYAETDEEAFVGKSGLVYPEFGTGHVVSESPLAWGDFEYRVAGIDPGGGDPTAIVPLGIWQPKDAEGRPTGLWRCHQPSEFYDRTGRATVHELIGYLGVLDKEAPFDFIMIDTAGGTVLLNTIGAYFNSRRRQRVYAADKDRDGGIRDVRQVIAEGRFTIHESAKNCIAEFPNYRWKESMDPNGHVRYVTGTPVANHGDGHDGRRYAVRAVTNAMLRRSGDRGGFVVVRTKNTRHRRIQMVS